MGADILLPVAIRPSGAVVTALNALREEQHKCPACEREVTLKRGEIVTAHFAHQPGTEPCSVESAVHKAAKLAIVNAVNDWVAGRAPRPTINLSCPSCGECRDWPLTDLVRIAQTEQRIAGSRRIGDVVLRDANGVALIAVEVQATHAVDDQKAIEIDALPWLEVAAQHVIENAARWWPLRLRRRTPCSWCRREQENALAGLEEAIRAAVQLYDMAVTRIAEAQCSSAIGRLDRHAAEQPDKSLAMIERLASQSAAVEKLLGTLRASTGSLAS